MDKKLDEAVLKGQLMEEFRTQLPSNFVCIRHEDKFTHGIPDISITGYGRTLWLEVKYFNPDLISKGIQELTMRRLAVAGMARYVVYSEVTARTYIVPPKSIHDSEET